MRNLCATKSKFSLYRICVTLFCGIAFVQFSAILPHVHIIYDTFSRKWKSVSQIILLVFKRLSALFIFNLFWLKILLCCRFIFASSCLNLILFKSFLKFDRNQGIDIINTENLIFRQIFSYSAKFYFLRNFLLGKEFCATELFALNSANFAQKIARARDYKRGI